MEKEQNMSVDESDKSQTENAQDAFKISDDPDETIRNITAAVKAKKKELNITSAAENLNQGVALYQSGRFGDALLFFERAAQIYLELIKEDENPDFLVELAKIYIYRGSALWSADKLDEVTAEIDKAIGIYQDLIDKHDRADFMTNLATAYMNKGVGLNTLGKSAEAVSEYDKAIDIYEKSIAEDSRPVILNELAKVHLNKGVALKALENLTEAVAAYDRSIAIYKDLIENRERADLAGQLAMVFMNKGSALEAQNDLNEAVKMFGSAIDLWEKDFKEGYSSVVPGLIKALRIRTLISVKLEDWQTTAMDVVFAMLLFENYLKKQDYSEHYKQNISSEFYVILFQIKQLAEEDREQIFTLTDKIGREAYDPPIEFSGVLRQRMELI